MKKTNNTLINRIVDVFDEAVKCYYEASINVDKDNTAITNYQLEKGRLNYYSCLLKLYNIFLGIDTWDINDEDAFKIDALFNGLKEMMDEEGINSEDIRRALLILDINGFKSVNFSLDLITPDSIALIIARIAGKMVEEYDEVSLLDYNFGTGNLIYKVINELPNRFKIMGIENHSFLASLAVAKANMLDYDINLYHQDALEYLLPDIDLVIADLAVYDYENDNYQSYLYDHGIRYFPYLAIEKYLAIERTCKYIYIIDNDFFEQHGSDKFKEVVNQKGHIVSLITLPPEFFQNPNQAKSLLILDNAQSKDTTSVFVLPSIHKQEHFLNTIAQIERSLK